MYLFIVHYTLVFHNHIYIKMAQPLTLIVDTRETAVYDRIIEITKNKPVQFTIVVKQLHLGDFAIEDSTGKTLVLFERKSFFDLIASIKDGRYVEQSYRLQHSSNMHMHNIAYIVEGMYSQIRNDNDKQMCISAMATLFYFKGFSVLRTCSLYETAELIVGLTKKIQKEVASGKTPFFGTDYLEKTVVATDTDVLAGASAEENREPVAIVPVEVANNTAASYCNVVHKVKKDNITPANIGEIILCSIPGISSTTAIEIMKHYTSFAVFMEELRSNPGKLDGIYLTTNEKSRKLGKNIIQNIKLYLA